MSFLAPLFLIGTLAVALPVIFQLVRRSSKEQIPFSSLMFLQPAPPRVTKRSRLEHLLLLLLRCLVVCLLALGFSRPFFQRPMTASPLPEETGRKVVMLVDTSASMKREGLWAEALDRAEAALKQTGPGDQVAVLTFDRRMRTLVSFEQWNQMDIGQRAALTLARISDLKPNWSSTQLGSALIAAAEAFTDADKEGRSIGRRQIILISDMQEGSRLDGLQGYEWPRGIEVQVQAVQPKRPTNAGVQWLAANDDSASAGTNLVTRIRVSNSANATHEQFNLHWADVPGAAPLDVYVPPGQSRIVPAPTLPPNTVGEQLVLTGDDDDFDNTVYVLQPQAEHISILFVGDEPENDATRPFYYLKRAFQPTSRQIVEVEARPSPAELTPTDLADARLLVVSDHLSDNRTDALQKFMGGGGTVLFVMKNAAAAEDIGRLAGTNGFTADEIAAPNYALFGMIDFNHPMFAPFADARFNDFTKIHFWKYRRVDAAKLPGARVLAKFDGGDPAILEIPRGNGRLLVLTSGWEPADSQLAVSSKFVPLLYSILDLSGGIHTTLAQFHIGDEVNLAGLMPGATTSAVSVRKPDGTVVQLNAGETRFSETDMPGIYSVTTMQPPLRFAVNLDGAESRTAMLPGDELQRLGVPMKAREVALSTQVEQKRRLHDAELEDRQKLWRWLTLTALVVLLGETFVAGWLTRRTPVQTGGAIMTDRLLKAHLEPLARDSQRWQLWRGLALCWVALGLAGLATIWMRNLAGWSSPLIFFALGALTLVSGLVMAWRFRTHPLDYQALARQIERENPQLHALLLTAVEQQPLSATGELNYLQQRVVLEALEQYRRSDWGERIARRNYTALGAQWVALVFLLAVLVALRPHITLSHVSELWAGADRSNGVSVTPGDASLERGSALVVLARFDGKLPVEAQLVVNPVNDNEQNIPLTKNLADPVFAGGVPQVQSDLKYHIAYSSGRTRDYTITMFDYPRLNHADATIDYPAYTSLPEKTIRDTRRVSAVEGSSLAYSFFLNKPVVSAKWVAKDAPAISLTADATNATIYHTQLKLDQSRRYTLVLVDDAGRTNKLPPEFVLDALKNRPAEVKIDSPRGDQRVSSLEEINFSAEASGEFGLHSYGIAYTLADGETKSVELGQGGKPGEKRQFNYVLPLESLGAQPDQLLSYYVWANDTGPDGQTRSNASDIFFAEIKPFDEIFRQAQAPSGDANQGGNQGGQQQNPPEQLTDLEKDIVTATWNIQRRETAAKPSDKYKDDVGVVRDAQQQALEQLRTMKERSDDPRSQALMDAVEKEMNKASSQLGQAADKNSTAPLPAALTAEQSAYQAALKLMAHEYQVAQARGGQGRGAGARSQRQINELDLQQNADRYETERQASQQNTPQQREQLQVASRLKDLAKRQQDLNARLREIQAALQEARTPQERAELQEQLKRLTEEQRDMLADVDELRQRMDNADNQSQMSQQRQQLDQTRSEVQRAAESLGQNAVPQALASGTRAQNELQQLQDDVRKMNSGQFSDDMRRMRDDASQISRNEQDLEKKINDLADNQTLGETDEQRQQRLDLATQFRQQKNSVSNLVDQMRQVSEQSETAEPLLSSQLYDTLRQTGLNQLDNSLDTTSEYVRRGFLRQAQPAEQPARKNIDELKDGVDRAAAGILGDGTEALRLAQRELQDLSQQLNQGLAGNANGGGTNGMNRVAGGQGEPSSANQQAGANQGEQSDQTAGSENNQTNQTDGQNGQGGQAQSQSGQESNQQAGNGGNQGNGDQQGQGGRDGTGRRGGGQNQSGQETNQQAGNENGQGDGGRDGQAGRGGRNGNGQGQPQDGQMASANDAQNGEPGQGRGGEMNSGNGAHGLGGLNRGTGQYYGPLTSDDYVQWTDGLRDVEEMVDLPDVSTEVAQIRERARALRMDYKRNGKRPDWAVITTQISAPLAEVRERVDEELLKRQSKDALVPLDRDPVPPKYSDQVKRYYEQLGKNN